MTRHHTQAMRAITLHTHGGPEQLVPAEIPDPKPLPDEVVVDLTAAALNRRDVWQRAAPGNDDAVLGSDGAGRVSARSAAAMHASIRRARLGRHSIHRARGDRRLNRGNGRRDKLSGR